MEWSTLLDFLGRMVLAGLLALPVAWHRELTTRTMGLRTFPLVAMASCAFVLLAVEVVGPGEDSQARIIQGLMTGMGFIGGGAILKQGGGVHGTATAASIWATGALGSAVGYRRDEIAVSVSVLTLFVLVVLTPIERKIGKSDRGGDVSDVDEE